MAGTESGRGRLLGSIFVITGVSGVGGAAGGLHRWLNGGHFLDGAADGAVGGLAIILLTLLVVKQRRQSAKS